MTSTRTAPVIQPADDIILAVAYFQRRATRKRADASAGRKALARIYRSYADGWTLAALDA